MKKFWKEFCKKLCKKLVFFLQNNSVGNILICPRANSSHHCLTELFSIYQNKHWTIRRRDDHIVVPSSDRNILKIDWILIYNSHSWAKFKIILLKKTETKFFTVFEFKNWRYLEVFPLNSKFGGSGFSFKFLKYYHDLTFLSLLEYWFWIFLRNVVTSKIKRKGL